MLTTADAASPMGTYGHTLVSTVQRMVSGWGVAGAHKLPRGFQVAANKYRAWQFFLLLSHAGQFERDLSQIALSHAESKSFRPN